MCTSWEGEDRDGEYTITVYGRTSSGTSVSVSTLFNPYFYVKVPPNTTCDQLWQKLVFFEQGGKYKKIENGPTKYEKVRGKELMGFTNNIQFTFMKFEFTCLEHLRKFVWKCKNNRLKVYENTISPLLRFMHRTGVKSTGWAKVTDYSKAYLTTCDVDVFCKNWKNIEPIDRDDIAPIKITSVDIECYSSTGKFPDADVQGDDMFQVAFTTKVYGTNEITQKCFCLKETAGYEWFNTECELLTAMSEYIVKLDPDIITGWNIFGFDLEYIHKRMIISKVEPYVFCMGRRRMDPCKLVEKQLSSSALGQNILKMLPMSGRYIFDLFHVIKAEHKLESYSLNNVSKEFLGDCKNDMPIHELFDHYRIGNIDNLGKVADYCVKDTELPIKLMDKLYTIENLVEMAKATWVPLNYLSERGQQIKVFSQIAKKARELGFMIPTLDKMKVDSEYEGATVLEAQTGAYYKPITALDFEGLYPSIMVAHNLCYSTIVLKPEYDNLPGVEYETHGNFKFAQNVESLLPNILSELKAYRKKAKVEMAKAKNTPLYHIYNGRQLAYKVSMNSVYGFTGAANGMLPLVAIASTVTAQGRFMIQQSKEYVEAHFDGAQVRYGDTDSIMVEFDVGERTGIDAIEYSWSLGERAAKEITKLFKPPNNLELEKVYCPYFLYSKKRYAAKMWVKGATEMEMEKIDIKGLQVVRRDTCEFVRDVCQEVININMNSGNSKEYIELKKAELLSGKVPMEKLILSKRLGDSYKSTNLAHIRVRDKIKERAPGSEPRSGDRVQFVIVKTTGKGARMYEKAEDPTWVTANNLELDYAYYYKHQFEKPVNDLNI